MAVMVVDFLTSPGRAWVDQQEIADRLCMNKRQIGVILGSLMRLRFVMHSRVIIPRSDNKAAEVLKREVRSRNPVASRLRPCQPWSRRDSQPRPAEWRRRGAGPGRGAGDPGREAGTGILGHGLSIPGETGNVDRDSTSRRHEGRQPHLSWDITDR